MISLEQRLELVKKYLLIQLRLFAPKDSWNLTDNGIAEKQISPNHFQIIIGGENAPYAVFTNEEWISDHWKGKKNPNQGWVERTIDSSKAYIQNVMSGAVSLEDVEKAINDAENKLYVDRTQFEIERIKSEISALIGGK